MLKRKGGSQCKTFAQRPAAPPKCNKGQAEPSKKVMQIHQSIILAMNQWWILHDYAVCDVWCITDKS
jgi:hypothetical protein